MRKAAERTETEIMIAMSLPEMGLAEEWEEVCGKISEEIFAGKVA